MFMCPLNHGGVPIFCPTASYITTAKRSVCFVVSKFKFALILAFLCDWKLYCFFRKCLRVGFGHSRRSLICSEFVFNIPDRSVHCLGRPRICNIFPPFGSVMTADNTVQERQTEWISITIVRAYMRPWNAATSGIRHSSLAF